ncbi:hypothetical protein N658DRAFT_105649 [Parathielavia hyrcaniae]|uniref:Uncharacterized protein n=1 Tax=Parathielavia hyrcaniae TaxID=113614 RepID=A0AAN6PYF8_9PEZI|nr:hypothetical protein N658DRAFT_105649 [Parathielavia hyrcaniae]
MEAFGSSTALWGVRGGAPKVTSDSGAAVNSQGNDGSSRWPDSRDCGLAEYLGGCDYVLKLCTPPWAASFGASAAHSAVSQPFVRQVRQMRLRRRPSQDYRAEWARGNPSSRELGLSSRNRTAVLAPRGPLWPAKQKTGLTPQIPYSETTAQG